MAKSAVGTVRDEPVGQMKVWGRAARIDGSGSPLRPGEGRGVRLIFPVGWSLALLLPVCRLNLALFKCLEYLPMSLGYALGDAHRAASLPLGARRYTGCYGE